MESDKAKKRALKYTPLKANELLNFTKSKLDVRQNNKFMNPYYVNNLLQNDERYKGWTFEDNKDIDGDNLVDSVIYDPQHQPVYFNGYYNIPNDRTMKKKAFYHDQSFKSAEWDNDSFKEYGKSPYEAMLIRIAKDFKPGLKERLIRRAQELGLKNMDDVKDIMNDFTNDFVRKLIHKFIVIPLLIKEGKLGNINLQQYTELLNQTLSEKDIKIKPLMLLYRAAKKITKSLSAQDVETLNQYIRSNLMKDETADILINNYDLAFEKQTQLKIGFALASGFK